MNPKSKSGRVYLLLLLCLLCYSKISFASTPYLDVKGGSPTSMIVGESSDGLAFDAEVKNDPKLNQECIVDGPIWKWTAAIASGPPEGGSAFISDEPTDPSEEDGAATIGVSFSKPGTYHVVVSARATYSSSCEASPVIAVGSAEFDVTVSDFSVDLTKSKADKNPAKVGEVVTIDLAKSLDNPQGIAFDSAEWTWSFGDKKYRSTTDDEWTDTVPSYNLILVSEPSPKYLSSFPKAGQYQIKITVTLTVTIKGKQYQRSASRYVS